VNTLSLREHRVRSRSSHLWDASDWASDWASDSDDSDPAASEWASDSDDSDPAASEWASDLMIVIQLLVN